MTPLQRGLLAEQALADLLAKYIPGLLILRIEARSEAHRGPRVRSASFGDLVELPAHDIHAQFEDVHFDIQLKKKGISPYYGITKYYTHGMDLPAYHGYRHLYEHSATPVWVIVWEEKSPGDGPTPNQPPEMLAQWFHRLPNAQIDTKSHQFAPKGMAYWPRHSFVPIYDTKSESFLKDCNGELIAQYELRAELKQSRRAIQRSLTLPLIGAQR